MKLFIKSMGIILMSMGLFGLVSGCGKESLRGPSGLDHKVAEVSEESVALTEKMSGLQSLAGFDEVQLSREIDSGVGKPVRGSQGDHQRLIPQGRKLVKRSGELFGFILVSY